MIVSIVISVTRCELYLHLKYKIFLTTIFILLFSVASLGQKTGAEGDVPLAGDDTTVYDTLYSVRDEFYSYDKVWFEFYSTLKERNKVKALRMLEPIYEVKLNLGDKNAASYSYALLELSKEMEDEGDIETAWALIDEALMLSPDIPRIYFYKTAFLWRNEPKFIFLMIDSTYQGLSHAISDITIMTTLLANLFLIIIITILTVFTLFSVFLVVKYAPLASNDIKEKLGWDTPGWLFSLFIVVLILFLASLNPGLIWLVFLLNVFFFIYYTSTEKVIAAAFYVFIIISPLMLNYTTNMMLSTHRDVMDEMIQIKEDVYTLDAEKRLKDWVEINPDDKYALFTLGLLNKKTEYLDYAKYYYERAIEIDPEFAPAINNLGNISFILHDYNRAKELYNEAININPDLASPHYNLYKINILELNIRDIDVADEYFNTAMSIAPDRVSHFVDTEIKGDYGEGITLPRINRIVMDEDIPDRVFWGEILKSSAPKDLAYDFWYDMMKGTNLKSAPIIGILALAILFGVGSLAKKYPFSKACRFCGKSFLLKSLTHMGKRDACNRCFAVYIRREGVDPKTKADLRMKVERINTIYKVILVFANLIIPGSGNIYRGKTKKGFFFLVLFTLFLIKMFTLNGIVVYPIKSMGFPLIHNPYLFGIILAIIYFFAQQDFLKSEVFKA